MLMLFIIHIIGAILTIIRYIKNGSFHNRKLYGDGIRYATPFQIIVQCIIIWEILLFVELIEFIEYKINNINW